MSYYVAPDALARLSKPKKKVFTFHWIITGQLEIVATDATEAFAKAIMISEEELAADGLLEMSEPEENGAVQ